MNSYLLSSCVSSVFLRNRHATHNMTFRQRQFGADLSVDVAYEWLTFFLEDDERLAVITRDYASGAMLTGEVKKELVGVLSAMVEGHVERRKAVTDDVLKLFMSVRPLEF